MVAHADVAAGAWPVQQRRRRNGGRSGRGAEAETRGEERRGERVRLLVDARCEAAQGEDMGEVEKVGRASGSSR
jgi:hypothetical protein